MSYIIKHLKNNDGYEREIIMLLISFVIGGILITLLTTSFLSNGPVNSWTYNAMKIDEYDNGHTDRNINHIQNICIVIETNNGNGTVNGAGKYQVGNEVELYAEPLSGYSFSGWFVNDQYITDVSPYTIQATKDTKYVAKFSSYMKINIDSPNVVEQPGHARFTEGYTVSLGLYNYVFHTNITTNY
jgi:hypothetical protein